MGEVVRECEGITYRIEAERRDRAAFDYTLALLIGHATVGSMGKGHTMPSIEKAYPEIFKQNSEDVTEIKNSKMKKSIVNFTNFANAFNNKLHGD